MNNGHVTSIATRRTEAPVVHYDEPLPILESVGWWNRPVHPAAAVAFVGACAVVGFLAGCAIAGYIGKKLFDAALSA